MAEDHCIGCNVLTLNQINYCNFMKYNAHGACPCTECVIKVMCSYTCLEFYLWRDYNVVKEK